MDFEIHPYKIEVEGLGVREGVLLEGENGWGEVAPFPGRSRESLNEALEQLKSGCRGKLFPSVEMGLFGLRAPRVLKVPVCLFLMGTAEEILKKAEKNHGCKTAKVKVGSFNVEMAVSLVKSLKSEFRLRVDVGGKWSAKEMKAFCSHFQPEDFEFIEDPGCDISPFIMGADSEELGDIQVWKPMVQGIPKHGANVILSSTFETAVGLHQIAALSVVQKIPLHPLGIGTFTHTKKDVAELRIENGELIFGSF